MTCSWQPSQVMFGIVISVCPIAARLLGVRPESVGEQRRRRIALDLGRHRARALLRVVHRHGGIRRQQVALARERDPVVAGVEHGFLRDDLELLPAGDGRDGFRRRAGIAERAAAGRDLLRIAFLVLDEPRGRLEQLEMRVDDRCDERAERGDRQPMIELFTVNPSQGIVVAAHSSGGAPRCREVFSARVPVVAAALYACDPTESHGDGEPVP